MADVMLANEMRNRASLQFGGSFVRFVADLLSQRLERAGHDQEDGDEHQGVLDRRCAARVADEAHLSTASGHA